MSILEELRTCGTEFVAKHKTFDINVLSEFLATNTTLHSVRLNGVKFTAEDVRIFAKGLKSNNTLKEITSYARPFTHNDIDHLADALEDNTSLTTLNFQLDNSTEDDVKSFVKLSKSNISSMELYSKSFDPSLVAALLSNLDLKFLFIMSGEFPRLCLISSANNLELSLNKINLSIEEYEKIFEAVQRNSLITKLRITSCEINMEVIHNMLHSNPCIKELILSDIPCTNGDFVRLLDSTLERLDICDCKITDISPLKYNTTLKEFCYKLRDKSRFYDYEILAEILSENNTLTRLDLSCGQMAYYGHFITALSNNNTLEELNLSDSVNADIVRSLVASLESNYTLRKITHGMVYVSRGFFSEEKRLERMAKVRRLACTKSSRPT